MKNRKFLTLAGAIALPLLVGGLSTLISGGTKADFIQPPLSPPGWVFGVAWTVLYTLMGIASYIVFVEQDCKITDQTKSYFYQLFVNFLWPIVFFRFRLFPAAVVVLGVLIILAVANAIEFFKVSKTAGKLLIPYILWLLFALYLNIGVAVLN